MNTQNEIAAKIDALLNDFGIQSFTSHLSYGEIAKKMEDAACSLEGFSEACYDQNKVSELTEALALPANETDMKIWDIDSTDWRAAIEQALLAKAYDEIFDDLVDAENDWNEA